MSSGSARLPGRRDEEEEGDAREKKKVFDVMIVYLPFGLTRHEG